MCFEAADASLIKVDLSRASQSPQHGRKTILPSRLVCPLRGGPRKSYTIATQHAPALEMQRPARVATATQYANLCKEYKLKKWHATRVQNLSHTYM